jgi:hypothetical protein
MNQPDSKKRKFTYFEFEDVFADLQKMAKEETGRCGHVVTVPELIRRITLKQVNAYRAKHGQKPLDYDPSAGKFAPGAVGSATQAVVDMKGKLVAYDRNENKLPEWKTVQDIPHLLRMFPRCKIIYASPKIA